MRYEGSIENHKGKNVLFLDLEMSGNFERKAKDARIIELALILNENMFTESEQTLIEYQRLFNPEQKLNPYVVKITGLTDKKLASFSHFREEVNTIQSIVDKADVIVVHNGKLDTRALRQNGINLNNKEIFDTAKFFLATHPEEVKSSLPTLCDYFGIDFLETHRAMDDVIATKKLYKALARV